MSLTHTLIEGLKQDQERQYTKMDAFSEKFQRGGGVIFNPKNYMADVGPLYRALKRAFREKMQYDFPKMRVGG